MASTRVADRLRPFGESIFAGVTRLANEHGAINLAQGFPDFEGPSSAKAAAVAAMHAGIADQYSPMPGVPALRGAIADAWAARGLPSISPETEVTVTCGCSEAITATVLGLFNPGDELVMFEPFFDFYAAAPALAGVTPRVVALRPDADGVFRFDAGELARAFTPRTRGMLLNSPHNPTGKVFTREELGFIAGLCERHGVIAISDEVYEHLTYEPELPHIPLASLAGMAARTVTLSSVAKSFNLTGWKVGWAVAPAGLTAGVRAAHQFITFATNTPLQHGVAAVLREPEGVVGPTRTLFRANRDRLAAALTALGLRVFPSHGAYFLLADHTPVSRRLGLEDDRAFCTHLTRAAGVAALPPSVFYHTKELGRPLARFAYCKKAATIDEAIRRLAALRDPEGPGGRPA